MNRNYVLAYALIGLVLLALVGLFGIIGAHTGLLYVELLPQEKIDIVFSRDNQWLDPTKVDKIGLWTKGGNYYYLVIDTKGEVISGLGRFHGVGSMGNYPFDDSSVIETARRQLLARMNEQESDVP